MTATSRSVKYVTCSTAGEKYHAFLPAALPPELPVDLSSLQNTLTRAAKALGMLSAVADTLPDNGLFLYYYVRNEAVLSSQIEGSSSAMSDLLLFDSDEIPSTPIEDVVEASSYVAALQHGMERMQSGFLE